MADIQIDRQAFLPSNVPQGRSAVQILSPILVALALAVIALVGYKAFLVSERTSEITAANAQVQQLEQQLAETQKRVEMLEKRGKPKPAEVLLAAGAQPAVAAPQPPKTVYRIASASKLPPQTTTAAPSVAPAAAIRSSGSSEIAGEVAANRQAWEATTNRLTDVVGTVGAQQGEINATHDALNQLLMQTQRKAVSFELDRGSNRILVGPVTLQFKSSDTKRQRFTVCVIFEEKCIELKDRALNEVVVFVVRKNGPPLELVATKILRDQIAGYLEVPSATP